MSPPIIACQALTHVYSGKIALNNLTFTLHAGESIGLVGPNGAGKTTLLSILSGFLRPTSGSVNVFGQTPGSAPLFGKVTALPQDARLNPNFTILEQLILFARLQGYSKQQAMLEAIRVLDLVALRELAQTKPITLSHGMSKRVSIAQALMGKPALVMLDEPTAGLDPLNARTVRTQIAEHAAETTFIISSHDLHELDRLCQNILLLENGVLKSEKLSVATQATDTCFITLHMESCPVQEAMATFQMLPGVKNVINRQKNEFIVEYDPSIQAHIDISLIQCIHDKHWQYRQLSNGKSLEEKLFFSA